jgi:cytidyltransferase-like protein
MTTKNIAFAALRMQPFTNGHFRIISQMIRDNDIVIIGLGSIQVEGTASNPFSAKQRTEMIRTVFGKNSKDKLKIVPLHDIGAKEKYEWVEYCMSQIKGKQLPTPTRYYAGSETDLAWFIDSVNDNGDPIELINLERHETSLLSGTFVRQSISTGTSEWKRNVPECLIDYIQNNYPQELLLEFHREKNRYM